MLRSSPFFEIVLADVFIRLRVGRANGVAAITSDFSRPYVLVETLFRKQSISVVSVVLPVVRASALCGLDPSEPV